MVLFFIDSLRRISRCRSPPIRLQKNGQEGVTRNERKKFKKYFKTSIISAKPVLLGMKGRIRHFLLRFSCRGEVIPFEANQTGKRYCAEKIL